MEHVNMKVVQWKKIIWFDVTKYNIIVSHGGVYVRKKHSNAAARQRKENICEEQWNMVDEIL